MKHCQKNDDFAFDSKVHGIREAAYQRAADPRSQILVLERPGSDTVVGRPQRRTHPEVYGFVSEVVYGGRLAWTADVARQTTAFGTGLRWVPVDHVGNVSASPEEAARIASSIREMIGASWTNKDGVARALRPEDFMVGATASRNCRERALCRLSTRQVAMTSSNWAAGIGRPGMTSRIRRACVSKSYMNSRPVDCFV